MTAPAAPFAWYGGKARLAGRIAELLPRHDTYVEVCGGAAAVLFAKSPAMLEVYNDVDGGLVTFFRVLRDRPDELARALRLTPYSRAEFAAAVATWESIEDDLERARRWYLRTRAAFAGSGATTGWGFETTGSQRGGTRSSAFVASVDGLEAFAERLRRVQIDDLSWPACLARYDRPGVAFYIDPPYHPATRGRVRGSYRHDLTAADHDDLVERVAELAGSVLVSGYAHPSYDGLERAGFERIELAHVSTASRLQAGRGARGEVVWRRLAKGCHPDTLRLAV